jgi:hypothetical protein
MFPDEVYVTSLLEIDPDLDLGVGRCGSNCNESFESALPYCRVHNSTVLGHLCHAK